MRYKRGKDRLDLGRSVLARAPNASNAPASGVRSRVQVVWTDSLFGAAAGASGLVSTQAMKI